MIHLFNLSLFLSSGVGVAYLRCWQVSHPSPSPALYPLPWLAVQLASALSLERLFIPWKWSVQHICEEGLQTLANGM